MIGTRAAVAVGAAVVAVTSVAACTGSGGESSAATLPPRRDTPEPTRRPTTTDPAATTAVPATLGPQYFPDEMWPPPIGILGPQVWPGDIWPPPPACFAEANICITNNRPTTTTTTTTSAPTTTAAVATIPQDPEVQAAVLEQVGATEAAFEAAMRNPDDPILVTAIEDATVEGFPAREEFIGAYESNIAEGYWAVPDPDVPNSITVEGDPSVSADGMAAVVVVCRVSGDTVMGRDANGDEQVISDVRRAQLMYQTFLFIDGTWKLAVREEIETFPEGTTCEPEQQPASSLPPASS